jgi:hypothetical protein
MRNAASPTRRKAAVPPTTTPAQVIDEGDGTTRFIWITDLLPDAVAPAVEAMMDAGAKAMRATLETDASA